MKKTKNKVLPHYGAFESTKICGTGTDILGTTHHIEHWKHDLSLLLGAGIRDLRYSVPWHRIEREPGVFDWSWMDGPMLFFRDHGMDPVVDPLHHTSFPDWLDRGLAHPELASLYSRFVLEFAKRYPWVTRYTIVNEPLPTTLFCSYTGMWHPHGNSDEEFVSMMLNVARAVCVTASKLRRLNGAIELLHIDTCESHLALDRASEPWVRHANARRFVMHDLICGTVDRTHPMYGYLHRHGARELAWFTDHAAPFDVLGLDYYIHSEIEWYWDASLGRANISWPVSHPRGFAAVACDYVNRFRVPIMLGETNLRATVPERITWLRFMEEQCELLLHNGVDLRGFCWYPSIDTTDWSCACTKLTGVVDPQGIWSLDAACQHRIASELSRLYAGLATGEITWRDLPAYGFDGQLDKDTRGYQRLMRHWPEWTEAEPLAA